MRFKGPELCDSWSERGYTHREEVLKLKITLYPFTSLDLDSKSPLTSFQNLNNSSVAEVLLQRWVICRDSSEVLEVNEITVRYIQGGYFVLGSSDCFHFVAWKLISSMKSVQVSGGQLYDLVWVFQLWLVFPSAVGEAAQQPSEHFFRGTTISPVYASLNHHTPSHGFQLTVRTVFGLMLWRQ